MMTGRTNLGFTRLLPTLRIAWLATAPCPVPSLEARVSRGPLYRGCGECSKSHAVVTQSSAIPPRTVYLSQPAYTSIPTPQTGRIIVTGPSQQPPASSCWTPAFDAVDPPWRSLRRAGTWGPPRSRTGNLAAGSLTSVWPRLSPLSAIKVRNVNNQPLTRLARAIQGFVMNSYL